MGPELAGIRVDTLLKRHLGLSGTVVRRIKWLSDGILVDGRAGEYPVRPRRGRCCPSACLTRIGAAGSVPRPRASGHRL